jgi:hypothetical protein
MAEQKSRKKLVFGLLGAVVVILAAVVGFLVWQLAQKTADYASAKEKLNQVVTAYNRASEIANSNVSSDVDMGTVGQNLATLRQAKEDVNARLEELGQEKIIEEDAEANRLYQAIMAKLPNFNEAMSALDELYANVMPLTIEFGGALNGDEIDNAKISQLREVLDGVRTMKTPANQAYIEALQKIVRELDEAAQMVQTCKDTPRQCDQAALESFDADKMLDEFKIASETQQEALKTLETQDIDAEINALGNYFNGKQ